MIALCATGVQLAEEEDQKLNDVFSRVLKLYVTKAKQIPNHLLKACTLYDQGWKLKMLEDAGLDIKSSSNSIPEALADVFKPIPISGENTADLLVGEGAQGERSSDNQPPKVQKLYLNDLLLNMNEMNLLQAMIRN